MGCVKMGGGPRHAHRNRKTCCILLCANLTHPAGFSHISWPLKHPLSTRNTCWKVVVTW
ncbi:hypothetical protein HanPSC8_Chr09g0365721 [Helianthus annuus]|nr:hypothetical protein HanPSC8_Chr09g0365721 [Helianthus annuus]